jgi:putative N6-adenine-specific DNA methylase
MSEFAQAAVDKPFARQIKRYLKAPLHRWAAITPREFSALCAEELGNLGVEGCSVSEAGVEFTAKLDTCYLANLWSRTASRIVCRAGDFRAGSVEQLFNKVCAFHWELWLNPSIPMNIEVHLRESRIEHEGLVEKTVRDGLEKRFMTFGLPSPAGCGTPSGDLPGTAGLVQRVMIHLRSNRCEISLDSSGAHLHQRGYRLQHAGAPLRETLAAAVLLKAGWAGDRPLIDGMCGAGTLAIEASMLARRLPPGLMRPFLFEKWPSFMPKTWQFHRREAMEKSLSRSPVPIIGIDQNPAAMAMARQNARVAGVNEDIQWHEGDFFRFRPQSLPLKPGLLFLNPPYGKRLAGAENLFELLGGHLREFYRGWQVAVMVPDRSQALRMQLAPARIWRIRHGGMPVLVVLAKI